MSDTIPVPSQPERKPDAVAINQDPVARSLAREDAFMKPAHIGKSVAKPAAKSDRVRVRLTNQRPPGRPRTRKRDPRDVKFF